jgi:hypothetical protein
MTQILLSRTKGTVGSAKGYVSNRLVAPMKNAHQLALAVFALAWAGMMLVTGQIYMGYRNARSSAAATSFNTRLDERSLSTRSGGAPELTRPTVAER